MFLRLRSVCFCRVVNRLRSHGTSTNRAAGDIVACQTATGGSSARRRQQTVLVVPIIRYHRHGRYNAYSRNDLPYSQQH